jgi:hypothetical protein
MVHINQAKIRFEILGRLMAEVVQGYANEAE